MWNGKWSRYPTDYTLFYGNIQVNQDNGLKKSDFISHMCNVNCVFALRQMFYSYVVLKYNSIPANKSFIQSNSNHNDDRNKKQKTKKKPMDEEDSKNVRILVNNFSINTTTYDVT